MTQRNVSEIVQILTTSLQDEPHIAEKVGLLNPTMLTIRRGWEMHCIALLMERQRSLFLGQTAWKQVFGSDQL